MSEKLTYHWEGDYLIPDLIPPESPHIGIWGERRRWFLCTHQKPIYDAMMMSGTLNTHLEEIDRSAEEMLDRLMTQMAERGSHRAAKSGRSDVVGAAHEQYLRPRRGDCAERSN